MHFSFNKIFRISRRNLLLIAAGAWLVAGGILVWRGCVYFEFTSLWFIKLTIALIAGIFFFWGMFLKISGKHIQRIRTLPQERPNVLSFFGLRSYLLMIIMIAGGIVLRTSHLVNNDYLSLFYFFMGTPLLLSAVRFVIAWKKLY